MKNKIYIIATWKSNKNPEETQTWFGTFNNLFSKEKPSISRLEIVVCPSFISLPLSYQLIKEYQLPIVLGSQNISPFPEGPYTGEVAASMVKELVKYTLIGHSERRKYSRETEEEIAQKVKLATANGIIPIVCVSQEEQIRALKNNVSDFSGIVLFEPLFAIGSGTPDTPGNAQIFAQKVKEILPVPILYGGSVEAENVSGFLKEKDIDGVIVGGASLDPTQFFAIVKNAAL